MTYFYVLICDCFATLWVNGVNIHHSDTFDLQAFERMVQFFPDKFSLFVLDLDSMGTQWEDWDYEEEKFEEQYVKPFSSRD